MLRTNIWDFYSHIFRKIKTSSDNDISREKSLTMYNVVIPTESAFNINHKHYCYEMFSEKCLYK